MADTSGPWDGAPWAEADWYRHISLTMPSGVHGDVPGTTATDGSLAWAATGLTITPAAGRANVAGSGYVRAAPLGSVSATANTHASFNRRDRVILRRSLTSHSVTLAVLTGTPASSPVAPSVTRTDTVWETPLFSFLVPPNSGTTITGVLDERIWVGSGGERLVQSKANLDAHTVGTAIPAGQRVLEVATGYRWEYVGGAWVTPLRTVTGVNNTVFSNISFAFGSLDFTSGGFTSPPVVTLTTAAGGSFNTYAEINSVTTTGAGIIARATANITATVPVHWTATGR